MYGKGMKHHQSVVDLMRWAIGCLKLGEFLMQEHNLQTNAIKEDIESLETHLRRIMEDALIRMSRAQQDPQDDDKHWSYKLRELSYDIEDTIDNMAKLPPAAVDMSQVWETPDECFWPWPSSSEDNSEGSFEDNSESSLGSLEDNSCEVREAIIPTWTIPRASYDDFWDTLENINVRVKNLLATCHAANFVHTATSTIDVGFLQARQPVGIHKLRAEVISRISSSSQRLKIVSIWAPGGMGKTTLTKAVYDNIKGEFHCCAFVSVGQQPDMKKALRDILIGLNKEIYSDPNMAKLDEGQLIDELQHFLENKRFLIVIDDIRDISSWKVIKCALVDNACGSRIITTSRVLSAIESGDEVGRLMPLSIDSSKELFYAILCGRKGTNSFDPLDEQTTEYILQKCGCVPLAIIMLASLLACKPQEEWTEVCNSIGFEREDKIGAENNTKKIIQFCYNDLPSHLKTCLLYLSIFPENHVIEKDLLVWRWVAEDFVLDEEQAAGGSLFKVGERYLYELISRSMMQLVENEDANIRACRVEGMVLDWIRTVAQEENFVSISNWYVDHDGRLFFQSNARIMAIHNKALDNAFELAGMWKPKARSFNGIGCSTTMALMDPGFQVLRVLSLEGCACNMPSLYSRRHDWRYCSQTKRLRFLGLAGTRIQDDMSIRIDHLRYLQTLDLTDTQIADTYIRALLPSVTGLRQLKCLRCLTSKTLEMPQGMGNLTSLEELRLGRVVAIPANFAEELSKLTELRVLFIHTGYVLDGKESAALVESLGKLQKIEVLELLNNSGGAFFFDIIMDDGWAVRSPCAHLVIVTGAFPQLRYMKMNTWLVSEPGAMPRLRSVELDVPVRALMDDANFDLHDLYKLRYLRLLEKVHVGINCGETKMKEADEVEAALRCVVDSHPNRPKLILRRIGRCIDEIRSLELYGSPTSPQVMPLELLREITDDFCEKQRLGSGTFGAVYKGILDGKVVAVKLLHSMLQRLDYEEEFMKEFENLRRLSHPNIVQLLGYCYEIKRVCVEYNGKHVLADKIYRALCFDYMHNGSLQRHLDDEIKRLDWPTCYKIIKGTCEGLKYLHEGSKTPTYHLDLKPGNILVDKNMVPKIADFGLSKLVCDNETRATSSFLGTKRYCPPEYIEQGYVSNKFDIFSLGVVVIEIIAGPEGYCQADEMPSQEFIAHVQENWRKRLQATPGCTSLIYECRQVQRCIEMALECVNADRKQRPNIGDITSRLDEIESNTEKLATTSASQNE